MRSMVKGKLGKWLGTALCLLLLVLVATMDRNFGGVAALKADVPGAAGVVGGRLPDFTLPGIEGGQVTLSQFYGKGPILVTFDRSLDW